MWNVRNMFGFCYGHIFVTAELNETPAIGKWFSGKCAANFGRNFRNEKNAVLIDLIHVKEVGGSAYKRG